MKVNVPGPALLNTPLAEEVKKAVVVLEQGGIVAFPTETFYGLAVDPFNEQALSDLFKLKGRPGHKPILVLIQSENQLTSLASSIPDLYRPLMQLYWPGPLTLVFPALATLSSALTGTDGIGVGVRISSHSVARDFGQLWGLPLTATSANLSGRPAARTAAEVHQFFGAGVSYILDGGQTTGGMSSTVVGIKQGQLRLIRAGVIDFSSLVAGEKG